MADYYPLIARAISGLDPGAPGEARRALYERARTALIAQLRGVHPPLTESEITRERLALEEAVRKVESEAAQRARIDVPRSDSLGRARSGDALRSNVRSRATPVDPNAASRDRPRPLLRGDRSPLGIDDAPRPPRNLRADAQSRPEASPHPSAQSSALAPNRYSNSNQALAYDPRRETSRPQPPSPSSSRDRGGAPPRRSETERGAMPGVRGFRDVMADADDLGGAAAQANRAARRTYANVPSPSPEFERVEPNMENRVDPLAEVSYGYDDAADADRYQDRPPVPRAKPAKPPKQARRAKPPGAPSRFPLKYAIILGVVLVLAGLSAALGPKAWLYLKGVMKSQPVAEALPTSFTDTGTRPKIADRVGQPGSQIAPVAQKVVLYDEDPSDPQGKRYVGTVVWRTDQVAVAAGQPPDIAVRGDVEVPDRKMKMTLTIRRNNDASLPATHTAELTFTLPADFNGGSIFNVPALYVKSNEKSNEQTRGSALAGIAVKVTEGFFLIGLSNVDVDKQRNIALLKQGVRFDLPLVYTNQRRAILAIEKGAPGERVFSDAFGAWGQ